MDDKPHDPDFMRRSSSNLNRITFAFAFAPVIYYVVAHYIEVKQPVGPQMATIMLTMLIAICIFCMISGFFVIKMNLNRFSSLSESGSVNTSQAALTRFLIAAAFHESIRIFAFVWFFMSGSREFLNVTVPISVVLILIDRGLTQLEPVDESGNEPYAFTESDD